MASDAVNDLSIFLEGKVVFKKTEKVIIYIITNQHLYLIDKNNKNEKSYKYNINDIYWDLSEKKDIELFYSYDPGKVQPLFLLHFFTQDEIEIFQYAIQAHKNIVKKEINQIIIETIEILNKQKIPKNKSLVDHFPFKETNSLHDILAYLLERFQLKKTYQEEDGFPIRFPDHLKYIFKYESNDQRHNAFYVLAGSFLSIYLNEFNMNDKDMLKNPLSQLFKKWINIAYIPSDFCYFYNRIQSLFLIPLSKFNEFNIKPSISEITNKFKLALKGLKPTSNFPLMTFARLDYSEKERFPEIEEKSKKENLQDIINQSKSTYIYYLIRNSNFIYNFLSDPTNDIRFEGLKKCFDDFTDFLIKCFIMNTNQKDLDLCFSRLQLLFYDITDQAFKDRIKDEYIKILKQVNSENQPLHQIKTPKFEIGKGKKY